MSLQAKQAYGRVCRELLQHADDRMDDLRRAVERRGTRSRLELERTLDTLRGQRNRAMARMEAARQACDDRWPFARAQADQAVHELVHGLDAVEAQIRCIAA